MRPAMVQPSHRAVTHYLSSTDIEPSQSHKIFTLLLTSKIVPLHGVGTRLLADQVDSHSTEHNHTLYNQTKEVTKRYSKQYDPLRSDPKRRSQPVHVGYRN